MAERIVDEVFYLTLPRSDGSLDPLRVTLGVKVTFEGGAKAGNTISIPLEELKRLVGMVHNG
jgi:hypothetical protein